MSKKAQAIMTDLMVIMIVWNNYIVRLNYGEEYERMQNLAFKASDFLVKTPGIPFGWDHNQVEIAGLAVSDRNLSSEKVNEFIELDEDEIKDMFNLRPYNFYFKLEEKNKNNITEKGSFSNADLSVKIERYVMYEGRGIVFKFIVWE